MNWIGQEQDKRADLHHRYSNQTQEDHVWNEEGPASVVITHVRKSPDIP